MHTTSGLLTYLDQSIGRFWTSALLVLALVLAAAAVLIVAAASGLLAPAADPIEVAPVRWSWT